MNKQQKIPASWKYSSDKKSIIRQYRFSNFDQAMDFMQKAAKNIGEMDHHPKWTNIYDMVEVQLSTHSENAVTSKDIELAKIMNQLADTI